MQFSNSVLACASFLAVLFAGLVSADTTCRPINPKPPLLQCGSLGRLKNQAPLGVPFTASSLQDCTTSCQSTSGCISYSINTDDLTCAMYSKKVLQQRFRRDNTSLLAFYNMRCFRCAQNLLQDGDFEDETANQNSLDSGTPWSLFGRGGTSDITAPGFESNNAFHWSTDTSGGSTSISQDVTYPQGTIFSSYFLLSATTQTTNLDALGLILNAGDFGGYLSQSTDWASVELLVRPQTLNQDFVRVRCYADTSGSCAVDNLRLIPATVSIMPSSTLISSNFDQGSLSPWQSTQQGTGEDAFTVGTPGNNGSLFAAQYLLQPNTAGGSYLYTPVSLTAGQGYVISFSYNVVSTATGLFAAVAFFPDLDQTTTSYLSSNTHQTIRLPLDGTATDYIAYERAFIAPMDAGGIAIEISASAGDDAIQILFDDIQISQAQLLY